LRQGFTLFAVGLVGLAACSRAEKPWIDRLEVDVFQGGEVLGLSKDQLRAMTSRSLSIARFALADEQHPLPRGVAAWRVKVAAGLTEPDLERRGSLVAVSMDVRHQGDLESFSIDARREAKPDEAEEGVEAMQRAIRRALEALLASASREAWAMITLAKADDDRLVKALADADEAIHVAAVRLLVRRHHKAALTDLLDRLKTDDVDSLRGVIGLLVELGAPESVNPLIATASQRGPVFAREVVFAIASIGGDDAEAYLDLVASGHDDEVVRKSAAQALSELRAKKAKREEKP
jgi:hypothetical protein